MFIRNNARTVAFWEEAYRNAHMHRAQQAMLLPLLVHYYFTHDLMLFILPDEFANGNLWPQDSPRDMLTRPWVVAHASWTLNATDKVRKFKMIGEWYEECIAALI